jgi:superfamily II DNA or RNA helicase
MTLFHEMKDALYGSEARNKQIISLVRSYLGVRKGLIFTERIEHAKFLESQIRQSLPHIQVHLMIGEVSDTDRETITETVKNTA